MPRRGGPRPPRAAPRYAISAWMRPPDSLERPAVAARAHGQDLGDDRDRRLGGRRRAEIEAARACDAARWLLLVDTRLEQPLAARYLVAPRAERTDVERLARQRAHAEPAMSNLSSWVSTTTAVVWSRRDALEAPPRARPRSARRRSAGARTSRTCRARPRRSSASRCPSPRGRWPRRCRRRRTRASVGGGPKTSAKTVRPSSSTSGCGRRGSARRRSADELLRAVAEPLSVSRARAGRGRSHRRRSPRTARRAPRRRTPAAAGRRAPRRRLDETSISPPHGSPTLERQVVRDPVGEQPRRTAPASTSCALPYTSFSTQPPETEPHELAARRHRRASTRSAAARTGAWRRPWRARTARRAPASAGSRRRCPARAHRSPGEGCREESRAPDRRQTRRDAPFSVARVPSESS